MGRNEMVAADLAIRLLVEAHAPLDLAYLHSDPDATSLLLPFSEADPFHPAWDDGCRDVDPVKFVARFLFKFSAYNGRGILAAHCVYVWKLFALARAAMAVSVQNCCRVLFGCMMLTMKWLEDETCETMASFILHLPFELRHKVTEKFMAAAMERFLFFHVFQCRLPFLSLSQ